MSTSKSDHEMYHRYLCSVISPPRYLYTVTVSSSHLQDVSHVGPDRWWLWSAEGGVWRRRWWLREGRQGTSEGIKRIKFKGIETVGVETSGSEGIGVKAVGIRSEGLRTKRLRAVEGEVVVGLLMDDSEV